MNTPNLEISAKLVMTLRDRAGIPMMKCKGALEATKGAHATEDAWIDAAIEHLRKQGLATADKFAGRETTNGGLGMALADGKGLIVLLGCQTDFVSGNDVFKEYVKSIADAGLAAGVADLDGLKAAPFSGNTGVGGTVADSIPGKIQQIGENLVLVKATALTGAVVVGYNHGGKIATLVSGTGDAAKLRMIALHVASANPAPIALDRAGVDPTVVAKEKEILLATPELQGKPEAMRPKIVEGKLGRFYKERVLLEQEMLLDNEKGETVEKYAKRFGLTVTGFVRLAV
ncbi:MAG: translation elongation factor Ts [Planctomycetes bacterium]|nr:translation elongation factor Ts [Planctomycetota bacterium]